MGNITVYSRFWGLFEHFTTQMNTYFSQIHCFLFVCLLEMSCLYLWSYIYVGFCLDFLHVLLQTGFNSVKKQKQNDLFE